jgi:hypothetical protein
VGEGLTAGVYLILHNTRQEARDLPFLERLVKLTAQLKAPRTSGYSLVVFCSNSDSCRVRIRLQVT